MSSETEGSHLGEPVDGPVSPVRFALLQAKVVELHDRVVEAKAVFDKHLAEAKEKFDLELGELKAKLAEAESAVTQYKSDRAKLAGVVWTGMVVSAGLSLIATVATIIQVFGL